MSEGGDWDSALLRLIDLNKYDQQIIGPAIRVLQIRGSFGRPEVQAAVITYFNARVKSARLRSTSDDLWMVRVGIGGLASRCAKNGGPDLLLAVLDFATSTEERSDPLLDEYTWATIADALLEKGDSRHLEGMRKLLAITKDAAVKEKLERAIANAASQAETTQPNASPKPSVPQEPSKAVPTTTPSASLPIAKVAESPAPVVEHKSPAWPWVVGIAALTVIAWLVLKRRV